MGIRPEMNLVFGVNSFKGKLKSIEKPLKIPKENLNLIGIKGSLRDNLYCGGFYEGHNEILGMKINRTKYDSDLVRALTIFHPEYEESGYRKILPWKKKDHFLYAKEIEYRKPKCEDIEFQWSWFYPSIIEQHHMRPLLAYQTRYILQEVGIYLDYRNLELFLVWDWI